MLQSEKFDPSGDYIRRWVPELARVTDKWIHQPWSAPAGELGLTLGKEYPAPVVDHAQARLLALRNYNISETARQLGMHRRTLARKLEKQRIK